MNTTARKGRKDFTKWRGTTTPKTHKPVKDSTEWLDASWDHVNNWWSSDWSTDLWNDPAWEQAARQLPPTQPVQEQSNPTSGRSISTEGGLTMCELSVDDEGQQNRKWVQDELMDLLQKWRDTWEKWNKNWVQKELNLRQHDGDKHRHKTENRVQNEMTDGHNIWNKNWRDNWVRNRLTGNSMPRCGNLIRQEVQANHIRNRHSSVQNRGAGTASRNTGVHVSLARGRWSAVFDSWQVCCLGRGSTFACDPGS